MLGRSTSFRPRPIDINQKLAVYLGGDAQNLGNSPSLEAPSTPELGGGTPKRRPRNAKPILEPEDIEAAIEECNANDDAAPIKPQEVATPSFRTIDDEEYTAPEPANPWKRPANYIKHVEKSLAALEKSVEYDLDSDDESFRLALNTKMKNKSVLNENTLEKLIDTFEKEYFKQVKAKGILASVWDSEEDFRCNVCNSAATEPKNPIIYCDTCDMTTHVECYGLHNTPRGSWFCTKCKSKEQLEVSCILCTERNGAFKRTKDGEWVHLACAMWLSEKENVLVPTNLKSTFVVDTSGVAREKRDLLCCICGRSHGACVTCSHSGCQSTYHITCSMRMGLFAEIKKSKTTTFKSFCKKHSTLYCEKKKESQKTKRRKEEEKIMGEDYTQLIPVTMLTVRNLGRLNKEVVQDVYDYWKKKRLAVGKPLIGRLQIEEEEIRHSSSYKQEREYTEMRKIRQGMEIARLLLDLVGKRERLKQRQLATMQELFEQELLLGEPFELPKTKANGETEKEKTKQPAKKETSVTHRRKSTGGAVKATVQQEIDDAVKKSATTSRRKSSTAALPDDARKKATAKKKEGEEEEVTDAGTKRKRSEGEGGNKRPRATKTRRRSNSLESGAEHEEIDGTKTPAKKTTPATKKSEARNLSANKIAGGDDQPKPRALHKRKREQAGEDADGEEEDKRNETNEKGETSTRGQDEEQGKKTATTAEVSPVKRVAKRRRLSASPTKVEPMEEEKVVNIVDSDEDVPATKPSTKGKNVSTRKAAPKDEEEPEEEDERDDHDDESNEGEQDGDDQDYMKGKRKRKRRSLNEVTAQRVTRAQAKWSSPHGEDPEEPALLPVVSKKSAPSGAHRPSLVAATKKPQPPKPSKPSTASKAAPVVKIDVVDDDDDEEDGDNGSSEEESYSPTTSPESSPLRRGKDTDGPIVAKKKRQTKINGFFAVVKKAEKPSAMAKRRRRSGEKARLADNINNKDVDEEDDDERNVNKRVVQKNREEEVEDDMDDDDDDHEEEKKGRGKKKVKAKRTSGGGRRSLAQQKATAAAAAAAAAKRPLQAKKSR